MRQGGLTPEIALAGEVAAAVGIPVFAMVRPHSRTFAVSPGDLDAMVRDIRALRTAGVAGVVFGVLRKDGGIDEEALARLLDAAAGLGVTFHRAFDEVPDQEHALAVLLGYPAVRQVLTSGGRASALEAADRLRRLVDLTGGTSLSVMAGGGLTVESLPDFLRASTVRQVHLGRSVRANGDPDAPVDPARVARARATLDLAPGQGHPAP